jgi:5-oxoprolinase (ATP-hydrolysing) subunit A
MITINCDIGERGADHPVDVELMKSIGMANIACGGHAGDAESVKAFLGRAEERGVKVAAHISYPDRENFGRTTMRLSDEDLLRSLDEQQDMMPHVKTVKFHGALYNDANVDRRLAAVLVGWMKRRGIEEIVTPFDSELAAEAKQAGIKTLTEAFAERRYAYDPGKKQLTLVNRKKSYASITDCDEAVSHVVKIVKEGRVTGHVEDATGNVILMEVPIECETICVHSDSAIALELVRKLYQIFRTGG